MGSVPFHYVDLRAFCYATEDERRVEGALRTFLPEDFELERVVNTGHHGDRIVVFSARVERADDVRHVLSTLSDLEEWDRVLAELDERVDDNNSLFLRLDKQAAFKGRVELGQGLTIRAKVEAYPAKREKAVRNARETFEELADEADDSGTVDATGTAEEPSDAEEIAEAGEAGEAGESGEA